MITVIIVALLIIVLRKVAKKHPVFAKWAKRTKIVLILIFLFIALFSGNGEFIIGLIEIVIGGGLIALFISFVH